MTSLLPLQELVALSEKTTPGPWENSRGFVRTVAGNPQAQPPVLHSENMEVRTSCLWVAECRDGEAFYNPDGNADFIAAARNSIPALRSLLESHARMEEALQALLNLRADTEMTYEDAYHSMFKSQGAEAWNKARTALESPHEV